MNEPYVLQSKNDKQSTETTPLDGLKIPGEFLNDSNNNIYISRTINNMSDNFDGANIINHTNNSNAVS